MTAEGAGMPRQTRFINGIKRCRQKYTGLSSVEVAAGIGVPSKTYANWEQSKAFPRPEDAIRLAELFGCSVDELYSFEPKGGSSERAQTREGAYISSVVSRAKDLGVEEQVLTFMRLVNHDYSEVSVDEVIDLSIIVSNALETLRKRAKSDEGGGDPALSEVG